MAGTTGGRSTAVVAGMPRVATTLPIRERRRLQNRLLASQEAAEKAVETIEDEIVTAYEAGLSYATVAGILSIHATTAKDMYDRAVARRSEGGS